MKSQRQGRTSNRLTQSDLAPSFHDATISSRGASLARSRAALQGMTRAGLYVWRSTARFGRGPRADRHVRHDHVDQQHSAQRPGPSLTPAVAKRATGCAVLGMMINRGRSVYAFIVPWREVHQRSLDHVSTPTPLDSRRGPAEPAVLCSWRTPDRAMSNCHRRQSRVLPTTPDVHSGRHPYSELATPGLFVLLGRQRGRSFGGHPDEARAVHTTWG